MFSSGLILSRRWEGIHFRIMDVANTEGDKVIDLSAPEDLYDIAALLRDQERFVVESIRSEPPVRSRPWSAPPAPQHRGSTRGRTTR